MSYIQNTTKRSTSAWIEELGQRLKQARLNADMTQVEVAERAGVSRKAVINAEKGKVPLETFITILSTLDLDHHLNSFLPPQKISPLQLAKLQGKQRQRASGSKPMTVEEAPEW
jgi:putative transcriptional regulator